MARARRSSAKGDSPSRASAVSASASAAEGDPFASRRRRSMRVASSTGLEAREALGEAAQPEAPTTKRRRNDQGPSRTSRALHGGHEDDAINSGCNTRALPATL